MKQGCRVTPGRGNPRESATEKSLPHRTGNGSGVMVKRRGKSPPRTWQQGRHGKPHPEQCRIGAPRGQPGNGRHRRDASARGPGLAAEARRQRRDQRNGHPGGFRPRTEPGLQAVRASSPLKRAACGGRPFVAAPRCARTLGAALPGVFLPGRNRRRAVLHGVDRRQVCRVVKAMLSLLTPHPWRVKGGLQGFHRVPRFPG